MATSTFVVPGREVTAIIADYLPYTLILMSAALILSLLLALPIGMISAVKQYSRLDYAVTLFSFAGISLPGFWFGWMLIPAFSVFPQQANLPFLPVAGAYDQGQDGNYWNLLKHLILPVLTLGVPAVGGWTRFIRSQLLEVLALDYVRTARAKGLRPRVVLLKDAFRNALAPLITLVTLSLPSLIGGAPIVETVFAWPGLGRLFVTAVGAYDWTLVMGYLLIMTTLIVLSNLLADVLYALADPRVADMSAR